MNSAFTQSTTPQPTNNMQYSAPTVVHGSFSPVPDYETSQMAASQPGSMPQTQILQHWGQPQQPQQMVPEKTFSQVHQVPIQPSPYRQAVPIPHLNMSAAPVDCPTCGQRQMTAISHHAGSSTHLWAGILCLFTGIFCFIPYLMRGMKDVRHSCGHCGRVLATWHKSGGTEVHAYA